MVIKLVLTGPRHYPIVSPGLVPLGEWHDRKKYVTSVGKFGWDQLGALAPKPPTDIQIVAWLKEKPVIGYTVKLVDKLNDALAYLIKYVFKKTGLMIDMVATTTFTLVDRLAYVLDKGANLSEDVSELTILFIRKLMALLGMQKLVEATDVTRSFLRELFNRLMTKVYATAQKAFDKGLRVRM